MRYLLGVLDCSHAIAAELIEHANSKLPDGRLGGIITGYEPDIRQEGTLMALRWWVNHQTGGSKEKWNPRLKICTALRYVKLRYIEQAQGRSEWAYVEERDLRSSDHPHCLHEHDYPEHSLLLMFALLVKRCLQSGSISISNTLIARMVYVEGMTIAEVAKSMGIHRSAANQQPRRVRLAVRKAAKTTDPTFAP